MVFLEILILMLALFVTLLCGTKLIIEIVSVINGSYNQKTAEKEGTLRFVLMLLMSIFWALYIVLF
jgi:hypothetical protein